MKRTAADYKAMEQWHREAGSNQYFVEWLQKRAAKEGAPLDAIRLNNQTNDWVVIGDLPVNHPFRIKWGKN